MAAEVILLPTRGWPELPDISWWEASGQLRQPPVNRRTPAEMAIIAEIDCLIRQLADELRSRGPDPPAA